MAEQSGFVQIKNWEKFQHYKLRNPPWIRLYNDLLDDYAFAALPDDAKWWAVGLWLLASRYNNAIPHDLKWIQKKINATKPVDLSCLVSAGFITLSQDASAPLADDKQNAVSEESRADKRRNITSVFSHWVRVTKRDVGRTKLTPKRSKLIGERLGSWSVEDLCKALDGVMRSEYHRSKPEYTEILSCLATDERVETHLARASSEQPTGDVLATCKMLIKSGGSSLFSHFTREDGFNEIAAAYPDLWPQYESLLRRIRYADLRDLVENRKNGEYSAQLAAQIEEIQRAA